MKKGILFLIIVASMFFTYTTYSASLPLRGMTVILDAGHGFGNDNVFQGYSEATAMLTLAHKIKPLLENLGATVFMTRYTRYDVPLPVRVANVNKWALEAVRGQTSDTREIDRLLGILHNILDDYETYAPIYMNFPFDYSYNAVIHPDWRRIFEITSDRVIQNNFLLISLHSNATPRPINAMIQGVDVFHISNDLRNNTSYYTDYSHVDRSRRFGETVMRGITSLGLRERGVEGHLFMIIREHNIPAVLVENGYHTNPHDRALLLDDRFLDRLARAYADAVVTYREYYFEDDSVPIYFRGERIIFSKPHIESNGFFFYPLEDLLPALTGGYDWCGETRVLSGELDGNSVAVSLDELKYIIGGEPFRSHMFFDPFLANDRVYVYLDIIAHALGLVTEWDEERRVIQVR